VLPLLRLPPWEKSCCWPADLAADGAAAFSEKWWARRMPTSSINDDDEGEEEAVAGSVVDSVSKK
jgi:hypothetical protein